MKEARIGSRIRLTKGAIYRYTFTDSVENQITGNKRDYFYNRINLMLQMITYNRIKIQDTNFPTNPVPNQQQQAAGTQTQTQVIIQQQQAPINAQNQQLIAELQQLKTEVQGLKTTNATITELKQKIDQISQNTGETADEVQNQIAELQSRVSALEQPTQIIDALTQDQITGEAVNLAQLLKNHPGNELQQLKTELAVLKGAAKEAEDNAPKLAENEQKVEQMLPESANLPTGDEWDKLNEEVNRLKAAAQAAEENAPKIPELEQKIEQVSKDTDALVKDLVKTYLLKPDYLDLIIKAIAVVDDSAFRDILLYAILAAVFGRPAPDKVAEQLEAVYAKALLFTTDAGSEARGITVKIGLDSAVSNEIVEGVQKYYKNTVLDNPNGHDNEADSAIKQRIFDSTYYSQGQTSEAVKSAIEKTAESFVKLSSEISGEEAQIMALDFFIVSYLRITAAGSEERKIYYKGLKEFLKSCRDSNILNSFFVKNMLMIAATQSEIAGDLIRAVLFEGDLDENNICGVFVGILTMYSNNYFMVYEEANKEVYNSLKEYIKKVNIKEFINSVNEKEESLSAVQDRLGLMIINSKNRVGFDLVQMVYEASYEKHIDKGEAEDEARALAVNDVFEAGILPYEKLIEYANKLGDEDAAERDVMLERLPVLKEQKEKDDLDYLLSVIASDLGEAEANNENPDYAKIVEKNIDGMANKNKVIFKQEAVNNYESMFVDKFGPNADTVRNEVNNYLKEQEEKYSAEAIFGDLKAVVEDIVNDIILKRVVTDNIARKGTAEAKINQYLSKFQAKYGIVLKPLRQIILDIDNKILEMLKALEIGEEVRRLFNFADMSQEIRNSISNWIVLIETDKENDKKLDKLRRNIDTLYADFKNTQDFSDARQKALNIIFGMEDLFQVPDKYYDYVSDIYLGLAEHLEELAGGRGEETAKLFLSEFMKDLRNEVEVQSKNSGLYIGFLAGYLKPRFDDIMKTFEEAVQNQENPSEDPVAALREITHSMEILDVETDNAFPELLRNKMNEEALKDGDPLDKPQPVLLAIIKEMIKTILTSDGFLDGELLRNLEAYLSEYNTTALLEFLYDQYVRLEATDNEDQLKRIRKAMEEICPEITDTSRGYKGFVINECIKNTLKDIVSESGLNTRFQKLFEYMLFLERGGLFFQFIADYVDTIEKEEIAKGNEVPDPEIMRNALEIQGQLEHTTAIYIGHIGKADNPNFYKEMEKNIADAYIEHYIPELLPKDEGDQINNAVESIAMKIKIYNDALQLNGKNEEEYQKNLDYFIQALHNWTFQLKGDKNSQPLYDNYANDYFDVKKYKELAVQTPTGTMIIDQELLKVFQEKIVELQAKNNLIDQITNYKKTNRNLNKIKVFADEYVAAKRIKDVIFDAIIKNEGLAKAILDPSISKRLNDLNISVLRNQIRKEEQASRLVSFEMQSELNNLSELLGIKKAQGKPQKKENSETQFNQIIADFKIALRQQNQTGDEQ